VFIAAVIQQWSHFALSNVNGSTIFNILEAFSLDFLVP